MKVAIRADASAPIGSGHIVRCMTLADALAEQGARVHFLTRALPPHLVETIAARGHGQSRLDLHAPAGAEAPQQAWPAAHQQEDARASLAALEGFAPDWLVVDHYGLDASWERCVRTAAPRLLAIDDLARDHECDLLLDANLQPAGSARYVQAQAGGARVLLGPAYALLRPEFAAARQSVQVRRGPVRRLLVFLGGMDAGNATGRVLDAYARLDDPPELDVVIGATHPAREAITAFCAATPGRRCHVQTPDMAALLARADAAVGAGGSASWERCCLGVPTLTLALAENQSVAFAPAAAAGLVLLPDGGLPAPDLLLSHLQAFLHNALLRERLSSAAMDAVDGRGALRVAAAMRGQGVHVRPAREDDGEALHAWRNAPAVRASSRNTAPIPLEDHRRWFAGVLAASDRALLVGEDAAGPVGVVRFDIEGSAAEVSIHLAPPRLGQGLGPGLLHAAERWLAAHRSEVTELRAEVLAGNRASALLFVQAGYRPASERFCKRIPDA